MWTFENYKRNLRQYIALDAFVHLILAKNLEATIIRDLLDGYDPRAFPLDDDKSVVVNVSYFLVQLQGLVSKFTNFRIDLEDVKNTFTIPEHF